MGTVAVNGISVGYADEGSGRPLVLIHGHPFDRSMWAPQIDAFAGSGWRVIAADLRGYGGSTVVAGSTALETFAGDIAALLDHLGVGDMVLGGLSMGGQIAMECYRQFGPRIRGLLLADTFPQADTAAGKAARNRTADRLLREGMAGYAEEVLPKMIAPYNVPALPTVAAHVHAMMAAAPAAGAAAALRGRAERRDYRQLLTEVTAPTLIVLGRDDEFTPVSDAEHMRRLIPHATLTIIDGAGHLPNLERPTEFNNALRAFRTGIDIPAAGGPRARTAHQ
ncbi:MAG TPA: alpha/beta fold hydrolase [Mycobacteriales bacterium]|nr:alpha/beta fold hydrolase [Mycobacteriales bacterium]